MRKVALAPGILDDVRKTRIAVGRRIAELRRNLKLTQADIATSTQIDESKISRIERGLENLTLVTLARVAHALGERTPSLFKPPNSNARSRPGRPRKTAI